MAKKAPRGKYPWAELHIEPTGKQGRAVALTIFLPKGQSSKLLSELKAAFRKPPNRKTRKTS
jgi:hypothetical protein